MADKAKINPFHVLSFLSFTCTALTIVSLISTNNESDNVSRLTWALGEQKNCGDEPCMKLYVGVWEILVKLSSYTSSLKWNATTCNAEYCGKCERAMKGCIGFVALSFIATWPSIFTNFNRASDAGNNKTNKWATVFTSFCCMCFAIISVVVFTGGCFRYIKDDVTVQVAWNYGPAWILMLIVIAIKFIEIVGNLYLPEISA